MALCFLEIGKNKNVLLKAREEIDRVLGERTEITYQDTVDLKYIRAIFKEALRLYPPAPRNLTSFAFRIYFKKFQSI